MAQDKLTATIPDCLEIVKHGGPRKNDDKSSRNTQMRVSVTLKVLAESQGRKMKENTNQVTRRSEIVSAKTDEY